MTVPRHVRTQAILLTERPYTGPYEKGRCGWCGEPLANPDGKPLRNRSWCYEDREGRDCAGERRRSVVWSARDAIKVVTRRAGWTALACVDCGIVVAEMGEDGKWNALCSRRVPVPTTSPWGDRWIYVPTGIPRWEADHDVPLEDGGEHTIANLRVRCVPCHRAKTGRENSERARRRSGRVLPTPLFEEAA